MKYIIEFELPDNDTIKEKIKTAFVRWSVWGYSGFTNAKPMSPVQPQDIARDIATIIENAVIEYRAALYEEFNGL